MRNRKVDTSASPLSTQSKASEIPSYIDKHSGRSRVLANLELSDLVWVGEGGDWVARDDQDPSGPLAVLTTVLKAIIRANPDKTSTDEARLAQALTSLLGIQLKIGRKPSPEYDLPLLRVADAFLKQRFGFSDKLPLDTLIRNSLRQEPDYDRLNEEQIHSKIKTMRNRFNGNRNLLLIEASLSRDLWTEHQKKMVEDVLGSLRSLGIKC